MTVKNHYDTHLGQFYSWMTGDFTVKKDEFAIFCQKHDIIPLRTRTALDLGAGHGIQTAALTESGFLVIAVDFCSELLEELKKNVISEKIRVVCDDLRKLAQYKPESPELIVCCGDTISHLDAYEDIKNFFHDCYDILVSGGKLLVSFRDYSAELTNTNRFIPVKSDDNRILTCFLEFFDEQVRVTDLLYQKKEEGWTLSAGSYLKLRISQKLVEQYMSEAGFSIVFSGTENRMISVIGKR